MAKRDHSDSVISNRLINTIKLDLKDKYSVDQINDVLRILWMEISKDLQKGIKVELPLIGDFDFKWYNIQKYKNSFIKKAVNSQGKIKLIFKVDKNLRKALRT